MEYTSKEVYEFVSKQTNDPIVERRICRVSWQEFPIYTSDDVFYDKVSPVIWGVKHSIPRPTLCPEERQRRRLMFRNERKLYKRKCDATGESIVSIYSPEKPYTVYNQKFRWSDARDPMSYGKDFDTTKPFTEQFDALLKEVPKQNLANNNCDNADYGNNNTDVKNCYMCFSTGYSEDCYHLNVAARSKNTVDGYRALHTQDSYEVVDSDNIYSSQYITLCNAISYSSYLYNCEQCEYCYMCVWQRNKKYMVLNVQYEEETYEDAIAKTTMRQYKELLAIVPTYNGIKRSERCLWHNIKDSKNCILSINVNECEDCKYCYSVGLKAVDCYDCGGNIFQLQKAYECGVVYLGHTVLFSYNCQNCSDVYYSYDCYNSSYLFGCVWLHNKQYCIFNMQYDKETRESEVANIIASMKKSGERGEFFNTSCTLFWYNETIANDYFPLTRDEALARWYEWQEKTYDPVIPEWAEALYPGYFSDADWSHMLSDDWILKRIIVCAWSGRPFRIIPQELEFYRNHKVDVPRFHPDARHQVRLSMLAWNSFYLRDCDKTWEPILSSFSPSYAGRVYSEDAYTQEIYK